MELTRVLVAWYFSVMIPGMEVPQHHGFYATRAICEEHALWYRRLHYEMVGCYLKAVPYEETRTT